MLSCLEIETFKTFQLVSLKYIKYVKPIFSLNCTFIYRQAFKSDPEERNTGPQRQSVL